MKHVIVVQEHLGEMFLYSNLRAAALDPCNPIDVKERRLHQLKAEKAEEQEKLGEFVTGYPIFADMCKIDRIPVLGVKDVIF